MKKININSWDFAYWFGVVVGWISMLIACLIITGCVPTSQYIVSVKRYREKQLVFYPNTMDSVRTIIKKHTDLDTAYFNLNNKGCFQYENDTMFIYIERR